MTKHTVPNRRRAVVLRGYDHARADVKTGANNAEDPLDAEANRDGTLAGRVVDSKGLAVPDTMVLLLNVGPGSSKQSTTQPATARTDAHGCFRFESLTAGPWVATASGLTGESGHGDGASSGIIHLQGDEVRTIELVLGNLDRDSGIQATGVVTDQQGRPLADAEVTITVGIGATEPTPASPASSRGSSTDHRGRFEIPALPQGPATLVATHAEHRDSVHEFTIGAEPNEVLLALEPGFEIAGSIRSSNGEPIPSAWLAATPDLSADTWPGSSGMVEVQAHRNGDYRFRGLNTGVYELWVSAKGYAKNASGHTVRLDERSAAGVDFVLLPEARVTVRVTGATPTGVRVHATQGLDFREAQGTEAGEYRLGNLLPGDWVVSAVSIDGGTVQQAVALSTGDDVVVELHFE